jgi:Sulfotransferase domain
MTLKVIGAGVGRTGTNSLRLALNMLGVGPCHHMEEVIMNMPTQVPLWQSAIDGNPDWDSTYKGYNSAVDWPTAAFYGELSKVYPDAKFILTVRSPESWAASFSETIYKFMDGSDGAPPHMRAWIKMGLAAISKSGLPMGLNVDGLTKAFLAHNDAVRATIPASRLLVYEVKQGWEPLCKLVGAAVPAEVFPNTNGREEFWETIKKGVAK